MFILTPNRRVDKRERGVENVDISVVIVNYNTGHLLHKAIDALQHACANINARIIIVDNASKDDSVEIIRRDFPDCRLIVNPVNVGFGRANNQAIAHVQGRYILLLNTDAFMSPDAIDKTVKYMDMHPSCGILGVKLIGSDGSLQPSARYFPTPWNIFLNRTGLNRLFRQVRMVDDMGWDHASIRQCDWVPGCYLLARRTMVDQIGLFDPRYFLYHEEVDLCMTAKRAGWNVVFYPDTTVIHLGGESAKSDNAITQSGRQISALQIETELLFFRKNYGMLVMLAGALLSSIADAIIVFKRLLKWRLPFEISSHWKHTVLVWSLMMQTRLGKQPTR